MLKQDRELLIRIDERVNNLYTWRKESILKESEEKKELQADKRQRKGMWYTLGLSIIAHIVTFFTNHK